MVMVMVTEDVVDVVVGPTLAAVPPVQLAVQVGAQVETAFMVMVTESPIPYPIQKVINTTSNTSTTSITR